MDIYENNSTRKPLEKLGSIINRNYLEIIANAVIILKPSEKFRNEGECVMMEIFKKLHLNHDRSKHVRSPTPIYIQGPLGHSLDLRQEKDHRNHFYLLGQGFHDWFFNRETGAIRRLQRKQKNTRCRISQNK